MADGMNDPVEDLRRRLRWPGVFEVTTPTALAMGYRSFEAKPSQSEYPPLRLLYPADLSAVDQLGLSKWHTHYEGLGKGLRPLAHAMRDAKRLLRQRACVIEFIDQNGRYIGSALVRAGAQPAAVPKGTWLLRRVVFDRPFTEEVFDASQYSEGDVFLERRTTSAEGVA